jgi:hypothetical protein
MNPTITPAQDDALASREPSPCQRRRSTRAGTQSRRRSGSPGRSRVADESSFQLSRKYSRQPLYLAKVVDITADGGVLGRQSE